MSDRAKRASWIFGILASLAGIFTLAGAATGHWSDLVSRVTANEVNIVQADVRMTRSEEAIQSALAEIKQDVGKIRDHLMERNQ